MKLKYALLIFSFAILVIGLDAITPHKRQKTEESDEESEHATPSNIMQTQQTPLGFIDTLPVGIQNIVAHENLQNHELKDYLMNQAITIAQAQTMHVTHRRAPRYAPGHGAQIQRPFRAQARLFTEMEPSALTTRSLSSQFDNTTNTIRIIDTSTNKILSTIPAEQSTLATFSPDGTLVALFTGQVLSLHKVNTGKLIYSRRLNIHNARGMTFPNNDQLDMYGKSVRTDENKTLIVSLDRPLMAAVEMFFTSNTVTIYQLSILNLIARAIKKNRPVPLTQREYDTFNGMLISPMYQEIKIILSRWITPPPTHTSSTSNK